MLASCPCWFGFTLIWGAICEPDFDVAPTGGSTRPYRLLSTRTAYDEVRGDLSRTLHQEGQELLAGHMTIRHGARFPGSDETEAMASVITGMKQAVGVEREAMLDAGLVERIRKWEPVFREEDHLEMAERGLQEMRDIADRLKVNFRVTSSQEVDVVHTGNNRTLLSARAFLQHFLHDFDDEIFHSLTVNKSDEVLLSFHDFCPKYIGLRMSKTEDREKLETRRFEESDETLRIIHRTERHLGLPPGRLNMTEVKVLYEACRYEYALESRSTWCEAFPADVLRALGYRQDMKYYWRYGYGREINFRPACVLLADIYRSLRSIGSQPRRRLWLRFGHSRTVLPLLALLGLFRDKHALRADNRWRHRSRRWYLAKLNPFSSNLSVFVYRSGRHGRTLLARVYVNERRVRVPECGGASVCPLRRLLRGWKSAVEHCELSAICGRFDESTLAGIVNIGDIHKV